MLIKNTIKFLFIFHSDFIFGKPHRGRKKSIEKLEDESHNRSIKNSLYVIQELSKVSNRLANALKEFYTKNSEITRIKNRTKNTKINIPTSTIKTLKRMLKALKISSGCLFLLNNDSNQFEKTIKKFDQIIKVIENENRPNILLLIWFIEEFKIYSEDKYQKNFIVLIHIEKMKQESKNNIYELIEDISSENVLSEVYFKFKKYLTNSIIKNLNKKKNFNQKINKDILEKSQNILKFFIESLSKIDGHDFLYPKFSDTSTVESLSPKSDNSRKIYKLSSSHSNYWHGLCKKFSIKEVKAKSSKNKNLDRGSTCSSIDQRFDAEKSLDCKENIEVYEYFFSDTNNDNMKPIIDKSKIKIKINENKNIFFESSNNKIITKEFKYPKKNKIMSEVSELLGEFTRDNLKKAWVMCQNIGRISNDGPNMI